MTQKEYEHPFVKYLKDLARASDRAALAALRRAISTSGAGASFADRYIVPWLPANQSMWRDQCYYLVAGLFATHPFDWPPGAEGPSNFGASLGKLGRENQSVERRFVALLNADAEQLPVRLRQAVSLLKAKEVPVDWSRLLKDLFFWDDEQRFTQREWARAFWGARVAEPDQSIEQENDNAG